MIKEQPQWDWPMFSRLNLLMDFTQCWTIHDDGIKLLLPSTDTHYTIKFRNTLTVEAFIFYKGYYVLVLNLLLFVFNVILLYCVLLWIKHKAN